MVENAIPAKFCFKEDEAFSMINSELLNNEK